MYYVYALQSDVDISGDLAADYCPELAGILPRETDEQKKCFDLLNGAYIDARYKASYRVTKKQLEYLAERVKVLQRLTKRVCGEKIESFTD